MSEVMNSLRQVSDRLSDEAFLTNKGLSNEVGIHVFCYDPKEELTVREFFDTLKERRDVPYRLIECDLYKIFLEICAGKRILNSIPNMEQRKGKEHLLGQLQKVDEGSSRRHRSGDHQKDQHRILQLGQKALQQRGLCGFLQLVRAVLFSAAGGFFRRKAFCRGLQVFQHLLFG